MGDGESSKAQVSACCSGLTVLIALVAVCISVHGLLSMPIWIVDRVLKFNIGFDAANTLPLATTRTCMVLLLLASIALLLAMLVGLAGACARNKICVAIATVVAIVYCFLFIGSATFMLSRYDMVSPTVYRQTDFLCNATTYHRLSANMHCSWVNTTDVPACEAVCQDRVASLLKTDGCAWLPLLCQSGDVVSQWWQQAIMLSTACLVTAVLLLCTTSASCCFLYSISMARQGKPSAENMCCLLLCPCCPGDSGKNFTYLDLEDETVE